jgi:hypothetical protein
MLEDKYTTVRATAKMCDLSEAQVRHLIRTRKLRADRLGWSVCVRRADAERLARELAEERAARQEREARLVEKAERLAQREIGAAQRENRAVRPIEIRDE